MKPFCKYIRFFPFLIILIISNKVFSQCPQLYDGNGNLSNNPYWISCNGADYTLIFQPDRSLVNYSINWGDGTPNTVGALLTPPAFLTHTYTATVDTFVVTLTEISTGCIVTGVVVQERTPSASIQIPMGDPVFGCTPATFRFVNASTNISETTTFTWNFGDGSPILTFDHTNWNQIVNHTYLPGTATCNIAVTLTAENYCNMGNPSANTYSPIMVWDIDDAEITASATLLCFPETTVTFTNTTYRNCYAFGNNSQRYEKWNFGNYWGTGHDSIVGWRPWGPPNWGAIPISYPGIGTYQVMLVDSSYCGLDTALITVQIVPHPQAALSSNHDTICAGQSITFYNNSTGGATAYVWNFGDGSTLNTGNTNPRTHTYNNAGNYTVSLTANIPGGVGCLDVTTIPVVVLPGPTADISVQNTHCSPFVATLNNLTINAVSYVWNFGDGQTSTSPDAQVSHIFENATSSPQDFNVTLTATSANGCQDIDAETITVFPDVVAQFLVDTAHCHPYYSTFTNQSINSHSWEWTFGDGFTSTAQNPLHTYNNFSNLNPQTFHIRLISTSMFGCKDTAYEDVTVYPKPMALFTIDHQEACDTLIVTLNNSSLGNADYLWDFGNGNTSNDFNPPPVVYTQPGDYNIVLIDTNIYSCSDTAFTTVTVWASPIADFNANNVCVGQTALFTDASTLSSGSIITWNWNLGNGQTPTNQNVSTTYNAAGSLNISLLVASAHCSNSIVKNITVEPLPVPAFSVTNTDSCTPLTVMFTNQTTGATTYNWYFGDSFSSDSINPIHTFFNSTTSDKIYEVNLIAQSAFGCIDSVSQNITVRPLPDAQFQFNAPPACSPLHVSFLNTSSGSNTYLWDFGDATPADTNLNVTHIFVNDTTFIRYFKTQLISYSQYGCSDTTYHYITVYPNPDYNFQIFPDTFCFYKNVQFVATPGGYIYDWDFGNGSSSSGGYSVSNTFSNLSEFDTTFTITLITTSFFSCKDTTEKSLLIHPQPLAAFSTSQTEGCTPFHVDFLNASQGGNSYLWNFGNGNSVQTDTISPVSEVFYNSLPVPVQYNISLVTTSAVGCTDTMLQTITVNPKVIAAFSCDTSSCHPFNVQPANLSSGASSFVWFFGDGNQSTDANPIHSFSNHTLTDTVFSMELIASSVYGCSDTAVKNITIYPKPVCNFSVSHLAGCTPLNVEIQNLSLLTDSNFWNFGDGITAYSNDTVLNHTYTNQISTPAVNSLQLISSTINHCTDTQIVQITINPPIQANFTGSFTGCSPLNVQFINQSTGASSYQWIYGDGYISSQQHPSHTYTNGINIDQSYIATLISTSQYLCSDTDTAVITVHPKPQAFFTPDENSGCSPLSVTATNTSVGANSYIWAFGDGTSLPSNDVYVTHEYNNYTPNPLIYELKLVAMNDFSCSDTISHSILVNPLVNAQFDMQPNSCSPWFAGFVNHTTGANAFSWYINDSLFATDVNPNYSITNNSFNPRNYTVKLVANSQYQCKDSILHPVIVFPTPLAQFSVFNPSGCSPLQAVIQNQSIGASAFQWIYGDGTTDSTNVGQFTHTYNNLISVPNYNQLILTASNSYGCSSQYQNTIIVYPPVVAGFVTDTFSCSPLNAEFVNQSYGAQTYLWNFGDGSSSANPNPSHIFINNTQGDVQFPVFLEATSQFNCRDTARALVTVYATPDADFSLSDSILYYPDTTVFLTNNTATGPWNYAWNFGDNTISNIPQPQSHSYNHWGEYPVTLIVSSTHCLDSMRKILKIIAPIPIAAFDSSYSGCSPLSVHFYNKSQYAHSYLWMFGDGATSGSTNPSYIYFTPGIYYVSLIAYGYGGVDTSDVAVINVFQSPEALFTASPLLVYLPGQPLFTHNLSFNADFYHWDFGDGNTSEEMNPTHVYTEKGSYSISLTAITAEGCKDEYILPTKVNAVNEGDIQFPNAFTPDATNENSGYYIPGDYTNDIFYPVYKGVSEYRLEIFSRWGELLFVSEDITKGWNGYYKGELCKQDVYVWKATGKFASGDKFTKTGDVTLLR